MQVAIKSNIHHKPISKSDQPSKIKQHNQKTSSARNIDSVSELNYFLAFLQSQLHLKVAATSKNTINNPASDFTQEEYSSNENALSSLFKLSQFGSNSAIVRQLGALPDELSGLEKDSKIIQNIGKWKLPTSETKVSTNDANNLLEYLKSVGYTGIKLKNLREGNFDNEAIRLLPDFRQSMKNINQGTIQKADSNDVLTGKGSSKINLVFEHSPEFENFDNLHQKIRKQEIDQLSKVEQEKVEITTERSSFKIFDNQLKDIGLIAKNAKILQEVVSPKVFDSSKPDYQSHTRIFYSRLEEVPQNVVSMLNSNIEFPARAEIVLNPKTFGIIIVEINASKDKVEVMFKVQAQETLKMLENQAPILRDRLQNAGFDNQSIDLQYKSFEKEGTMHQDKQEQKQTEQNLLRDFIRSFAYLKGNNELDFENYSQNTLEALW